MKASDWIDVAQLSTPAAGISPMLISG